MKTFFFFNYLKLRFGRNLIFKQRRTILFFSYKKYYVYNTHITHLHDDIFKTIRLILKATFL